MSPDDLRRRAAWLRGVSAHLPPTRASALLSHYAAAMDGEASCHDIAGRRSDPSSPIVTARVLHVGWA